MTQNTTATEIIYCKLFDAIEEIKAEQSLHKRKKYLGYIKK